MTLPFLVSGLLACALSCLAAGEFGAGGGGFLIGLAVLGLQLGLIAELTSLVGALTPFGWLSVQVLLLAAALYALRRQNRLRFFRPNTAWFGSIERNLREFLNSLSPVALAALTCAAALVILSGIAQFCTPIYKGDEKVYHASRVIYWIQHRNLFPYLTHNDRQTVFTFGAELYFLWPVLLTRSETVGRVIFWLGYPVAGICCYQVLRLLKLERGASIAGVLAFLSTPIISTYSVGLKPDMWSAAYLLGTGYWAARTCIRPLERERNLFCLGMFAILAVNARPLSLSLVPFVAALPFLVRGAPQSFWPRCKPVVYGAAAGILLSGLAVTFGFNQVRYGDILGPAAMRKVHESDLTPHQLYTHAVRFPFLLLELPDVPVEGARKLVSAWGKEAIEHLGAAQPLPQERPDGWPGMFVFNLPEHASRFSIAGMVWLAILLIATLQLLQNILATMPRIKLAAVPSLTLLAVPLTAATLFGVRWMAQSELPERFLIGPFALGICIVTALAASWAEKSRAIACVIVLALVYSVYWPLRDGLQRADLAAVNRIPAAEIDAPFGEALGLIGCGARILFVGGQYAPDYPLFGPREGYCNSVVSWGKAPFDPRRMRDMIQAGSITHVLIEHDESVGFHWDPAVSTKPMVEWLSKAPGIQPIPLVTPHVRLFATQRASLQTAAPKVLNADRAPRDLPLVFMDARLRGLVGVGQGLVTPWSLEDPARTGHGFLWIGAGRNEGLEFTLWAKDRTQVELKFDISSGISRNGSHTASFAADSGAPQVKAAPDRGSLVFDTALSPGRNIIRFWTDDEANVPPTVTHDNRHLMLGLYQVSAYPVEKK